MAETNTLETILNIKLTGFELFTKGMKKLSMGFNELMSNSRKTGQAITEASSGFTAFGDSKNKQSMQSLNQQFGQMNEQLKPLANEVRESLMASVRPSLTAEQAVQGLLNRQKELSQWSKQYGQQLQKNNTALKTFRSNLTNVAKASAKLTMEFLGVMFFGMMLQRVFRGFLQPAMDAFGVMELWGTMLMVLFIPIISELFPYFLQLITYFMNLDEGTKLLIGAFTIFVTILGVAIMVLGQLGLGIGSVFRLVMFISSIFESFGIVISGAFLAILAVVIVVLIGIWMAWRENFGNIRDWFSVFWDGVGNMVGGFMDYFKGIFKIIKGIFTGDFDLAIEGVKQMFKGFITFMGGWVKSLLSLVVIVGLGILKLFVNVINFIAQAWWKLFQKLDEWSGGWVTRFIGYLLTIISFINKIISRVVGIASKVPGLSKLKDIQSISTSMIDTARGNIKEAGSIQNIEISQVFNISDKSEMERMIDDNNRRVVDDLMRLVKTPA